MAASQDRARSYLLVLEDDSSSLFPLPARGVVTIGRSTEVDLRIRDQRASRKHAQLNVGEEIVVTDLDSQDGTRINGEPLRSSRVLASGDLIAIGGTTLVFHSAPPSERRTRTWLDYAELRRRLDQEINRSVSFDRPLCLVALDLESGARETVQRSFMIGALEPELRSVDLVGELGEGRVVVALPEMQKSAALDLAERLIAALAEVAPAARAAVAALPADGTDSDTLTTACRAALALAPPRGVRDASDCATRLRIGDHEVLIADPQMLQIYELIRRLARSDLSVLLQGETGVGKELAAQAVHAWSARAARPCVTLNCATIPETLFESELFGHEKGAFSGAIASKMGRLEQAKDGTVFLDEIAELPLGVQAKLLRAIDTSRLTPLGSTRERTVNVRVVAATNRDLEAEVRVGRFREDLYFRLGGAKVILPPLRERPREVALLARLFLDEACAAVGGAKRVMTLSPAALRRLMAYGWPGNLRELKHAISYAVAAVEESTIEPWHLPDPIGRATGGATERAAAPGRGVPFRPIADEIHELERKRMRQALEAAEGVQVRAADLISMPLRTFTMKMKQYGLSPRRSGS